MHARGLLLWLTCVGSYVVDTAPMVEPGASQGRVYSFDGIIPTSASKVCSIVLCMQASTKLIALCAARGSQRPWQHAGVGVGQPRQTAARSALWRHPHCATRAFGSVACLDVNSSLCSSSSFPSLDHDMNTSSEGYG